MPVHIHQRHAWDVSPEDAVQLQRELAPQVITDQPLDLDGLAVVGGVDVSVKHNISRAAVVALSYPDLRVIEARRAAIETPFPYIPGLLSFREGAVILEAMRALESTPDVFIFDGQGVAHPRRIGIAAHIGLFIDVPAVGCAKKRLTSRHAAPGTEKGSWSPLEDDGEVIGMVLRTRTDVKPVFVSVGHRATLATAHELVLRCVPRYRLPEPVRAAHKAAGLQNDPPPDQPRLV
jgi:deoxyribonuclease V